MKRPRRGSRSYRQPLEPVARSSSLPLTLANQVATRAQIADALETISAALHYRMDRLAALLYRVARQVENNQSAAAAHADWGASELPSFNRTITEPTSTFTETAFSDISFTEKALQEFL